MSPETRRKWLVWLLVATVLAIHPGIFASVAWADGEIDGSIVSVDDSQFPVVTIVVEASVGGRPLSELTASRLAVRESGSVGREVQVKSVMDASLPLELVIAIDTSGSMAGPSLVQARAAAETMIGSLQAQDYAAVVSFATAVKVEQTATLDHAKAIAAVRALQAGGNTALYEAVAQSAAVASAAVVPRRAVVLLTDGENFGPATSATRDGSIAAAAGASGGPFYTVGVGATVDDAYLAELAAKTGGRKFQASGPDQIAQVYEAIQQLLRSQLAISFVATSDPGSSSRTVDVAITDSVTGASGTFHRDYQTRRVVATVAPTATPAPVTPTGTADTDIPPEATSTTDEGGSGSWRLLLLLLVLVGLLGAGSVVYLQRLRPARRRGGLVEAGSTPWPPADGQTTTVEKGRVRLLSLGPDAETVETIEVSTTPVTLGSSPGCDIRLPEADGVGGVHARLWLKDGTPVVHHLAAGKLTIVDGHPAEWASLRPGSILQLGPFRYRVADD